MHKLKDELKKEIKELTEKGIRSKDVMLLGQLIDMYKDLEEVCYWESKMGNNHYEDKEHEYEVEWTHEGMTKHEQDVHAKLEEIRKMMDVASRGGQIDKAKFDKYIEEMIDTSEKIHTVVGRVKMPDNMVARFKALYK